VREVGETVYAENGEPLRSLGTVQDVTELKQAEDRLHDYQEHLEELVDQRTRQVTATNQELEAFSYSVSHDLRAPLRAIDGFSQALLEDYAPKLDPTGRDYLQRVRTATQNMGRLIDELIALARATRAELRHETVDLSALGAAIAAELARADPQRQVAVEIEPDLVAEGDAPLLRLLLENLLDNAWKFTGKTPQARIQLGAAPGADGQRAFFVRDNGAGFDMAYADKLFSAFQRLHGPADFPGAGIGLATVQRIVRRHGGRIWAEAQPGRGATFHFTLPASPAA
jgi:signal transduction histidine kinase